MMLITKGVSFVTSNIPLYKSVTLAIEEESPHAICRNRKQSKVLYASKDIFFATFRVLNK